MGYDVWCLNARGNKYSTHKTLNKVNNAADFYNFTWQHKGQFDIPAAIDYIKATTFVPKVILWTTGQMTTGILRFAAYDSYYLDNVSVVVADTPCFINKTNTNTVYAFGLDWYDSIVNAFKNSNIYTYCGPQWTNDKAFLCDSLKQTVGSCHFDNFCNSPLYPNAQPESWQTLLHDYQVSKQGKIRDFLPGFSVSGDSKTRQTTEYDLSAVKVPFLFYVGEDANNVCNLTDAKDGATAIG